MIDDEFEPDWVVAPGETLQEWIDEHRWSLQKTARACHMSVGEVEAILDGDRRITSLVADKLYDATGIPSRMWLGLERNFRRGLAQGKAWVH